MTLKQATARLSALGFKMGTDSPPHGTIGAEAFNYAPHKILSTPFRDVFVGQSSDGFYITSHINFTGKRFRSNQTHQATILNIFGGGATLKEAVAEFEINFKNKTYNGYSAVANEGATSKEKCGGGTTLVPA